jgi:hypothetical protein
MKSLLRLLESAREDDRHVRFLFIGVERPKAADGDEEDALALARRQFNERHRKRRREWSSLVGVFTSALSGLPTTDDPTTDDGATDMRTVYEKIIGLVAPYLEVFTSHLIRETLPHAPFPRLHSLAVTEYNLAGSTPLPHLRHLHILALCYAHVLPLWVAGAPELEHLRLSGVWAQRELPEVLGALMGVEEQHHSDMGHQLALMAGMTIRPPRPDIQALKCLRTVVVDTQESTFFEMCGNPYSDHNSMKRGLACLESETADGPVKLLLVLGGCRSDEQSMIEWRGMVEKITDEESLKE